LLPGVAGGLRRFAAADYKLIVVSNQSGIARGYFVEEELAGVEQRLRQLIVAEAGVELAAFITAPITRRVLSRATLVSALS